MTVFSVWLGAHTAEQPLNGIIKIHRHLIWCEVTITRQSATSVRINRHVSSTALGDMLIGSLMMRTHDHDVPQLGTFVFVRQPTTHFLSKEKSQENSTQDKKPNDSTCDGSYDYRYDCRLTWLKFM